MKKIDTLNLIPFIDIMLVLLVIVLMSASFVNYSLLEVEIPKLGSGNTEQEGEQPKEIIITIDKEGGFYLRDEKLDLVALKNKIALEPKNSQIIIKGDKRSDLEDFLKVSLVLSELEFSNVFVLTDKEE